LGYAESEEYVIKHAPFIAGFKLDAKSGDQRANPKDSKII
jgi:predicted methyltransferase